MLAEKTMAEVKEWLDCLLNLGLPFFRFGARQVVLGKLTAGSLSTFVIYALYVGTNAAGVAQVVAQLIQASNSFLPKLSLPCLKLSSSMLTLCQMKVLSGALFAFYRGEPICNANLRFSTLKYTTKTNKSKRVKSCHHDVVSWKLWVVLSCQGFKIRPLFGIMIMWTYGLWEHLPNPQIICHWNAFTFVRESMSTQFLSRSLNIFRS